MVNARSPNSGSPPTAAISGVMRSFTTAFTTAVNAVPITTATARSTMFPRSTKARNSRSMTRRYARERMDLSLFFAGTGGSVPTARRGLPAVLMRRGGDRILFDCGEGTQRQLLRTVGLPDIEAVYLTHLHVDHWLGLPGMLKSFDLRDREAPLAVYGPPGTGELMRAMKVVYGRLRYPFGVVELEAGEAVRYDGYEVGAFNVRHRTHAFGYAIVEDDRPGRFDAELAAEL